MAAREQEFLSLFGRTRSDYAYCNGLTKSEWAWEFLRRNKDYRIAVKASRIQFRKTIKHVSGIRLHHLVGNHTAAHGWGLSAFADPMKNALQTDIFWSPAVMKTALRAEAIPSGNQPDLDLFRSANCVALLKAHNHQKLLIRTTDRILDLTLVCGSPLLNSVDLTFQIDGIAQLKPQSKALVLIQQALLSDRSCRTILPTKRVASNHLRALVALDCLQKSGSLQDTAIVFRAFGMTRLAWSAHGDESLKKQIIRARKRGQNLMQAGYKSLL